jgi:hypothetical protein
MVRTFDHVIWNREPLSGIMLRVWHVEELTEEESVGNHRGRSRIRLHENISLLQMEDRVSLDLVLADKTASKYLLTRLSDTIVVVEPGQFDALLRRLLRLGHTPKVLEAEQK